MRVKKAVIPAAGLGTRFLPATKAQPKEMLPLVDTPIIQYVVEEALAAGIQDILLVTGKNKRAIEDHFDRAAELESHLKQSSKGHLLDLIQQENEAFLHYVRQPEPRGLGHAVLMARHHVGQEPFAVLLGDEIFVGDRPCLAELVDVATRLQASVIAVVPVPPQEVSRYGVVSTVEISPGLYRVHDLVEKPPVEQAPSNLAIVGRYVLDPEVFAILERQPPGFGGEIQLTDALRELALRKPLYAYRPRATRYDVGDKLGFLMATVEFALARADLGPPFRAFLEDVARRPPQHPRTV